MPLQADTPVLVSVVLTAHDEGRHIRQTIAALGTQTGLAPGALELVLVDDRSTDNTVAEALAAGHPTLTLLHAAPDPGLALTTRQQALDLGFSRARGRVILTLDADSLPPPGWAVAMSAPILAGLADAVAGPIGFVPGDGIIARWQSTDAAYYFQVSALLARFGLAGGVFFGNFAFRADLYAELGGFARIGFALTEDLAFATALRRAGARVCYLAAAQRVDVRACPDLPALIKRTLRVTAGPLSPLAAVLTLWPLLLPVLAVAALAGVAGAGWLLGLRYLAGVALVWRACGKNAAPGLQRFAPFYEPLVVALAVAALPRRLARRSVEWGGRNYG